MKPFFARARAEARPPIPMHGFVRRCGMLDNFEPLVFEYHIPAPTIQICRSVGALAMIGIPCSFLVNETTMIWIMKTRQSTSQIPDFNSQILDN